MVKVAVIGGGASGMFAAIAAARNNAKVTIYEKLDRVGKRLLVTGNGRCNITNADACEVKAGEKAVPLHYYGQSPNFAVDALTAFSVKDTIDFFGELGVIMRCESGKYFPFSEQAATILDVLRFYCQKLGVRIINGKKIVKIERQSEKFVISDSEYDRCIVCCGGKSSSHLGADGSGYALLESFGHKTTPLFPAITQVKTETELVRQLKGVKCDAAVSVYSRNELKRCEFGQVLFTEYGLSGPPILQISPIVSAAALHDNCIIALDFMRDLSEHEVFSLLQKIKSNPFKTNITLEDFLLPCLNKRLGQVIIKKCGFRLSTPLEQLDTYEIEKISNQIKRFTLKTTGVKDFTNAQITGGGIKTDDFNSKTMQSGLCENLYACGEILDINGDCGGYNLQWAFSSGFVAGVNAAKE